MLFIRSAIFSLFFISWTASLCVVFIPVTWFGTLAASWVGRLWAKGIVLMLRVVCCITHTVEGLENLPDGPCVIASKHQSAWDTMIFFTVIKHPVFVMKKELLSIPLFGPFLARMGMIPVDRQGGASTLKQMLRDVKDRCAKGMSPVVFPEGTRTEVGQVVTYHPGIASMYNDPEINIPFIPVALDSGKCWGKNSFIKKPGVIHLRLLPAIKKGKGRKAFMAELQEKIEKNCAEL